MKVLVASSERFAGCIVDTLQRNGHEVVAVVSPLKGIYERQSYGSRFWPYFLRGWDVLPMCRKLGVEFRVLANLKDGALQAFLRNKKPDLLVVFGWPTLIDEKTLASFTYGGLNIHPSLLPKLRGPDPLFHILDQGTQGFGVSFHKLTENLDAGPIHFQAPLVSRDGASYDQLYCRILDGIFQHLPTALNNIQSNPEGKPQTGKATFVKRFHPRKRVLDLTASPESIWRRTRACYSHHSRITASGETLLTFTHFETMPYRDLIYKTAGSIQRVGIFSLEVNIAGRYVRLRGVQVFGLSRWLSPFHLFISCKPGQLLSNAADVTRLAKEQSLL